MAKVYHPKGNGLLFKILWLIPFVLPLIFVVKHQEKEESFSNTIISVRVSNNNDDAEEKEDNSVDTGSSDLELGEDGNTDQICGMRFQALNIPKGVIINSAYIEFYADGNHSDVLSVDIYGEDTGSANTFVASSKNLSNRDTTFARVHWDNIQNWTDNNLYQTPDISSIIQEIVNRSDWAALNDLVIFIEMDGSTGTRRAESHNGNADVAPLLVIDYEPAASSTFIYDNTMAESLAVQGDCNNVLTKTITIPDSFFIEDLSVGLNVAHTYRGDLEVQLTSPAGTTVTLVEQKNDSDDNYDLLLTDASGNSIDNNSNNNISSPIYQNDRSAAPANALSTFDGEQAKGNWTLTFCNVNQGNSGGRILTFNSARLLFEGISTYNCLLSNIETATTCNNNNTTNITDDFYTITVQPIGINLGSAYNVSGNYGSTTFSENNLSYGVNHTLAIQVPIGTSTNLTITDVDSSNCSILVQLSSPLECSTVFTCWAISDEGNPDVLFKYTSENNVWTKIGPTGVNGIESLAYNPFTDEIYTADKDLVGKVDLSSGQFTALGTDIGALSGANNSHDIEDIDGLSLDPFTGILWATERIGSGTNNDYLFQIDTATGNYIPDAFGTGIDYVVVSEVYDPVNGQFVYDVDDIAVDPETGALYAICNQGGSGGVLTIINKSDGSIKQTIGNFGIVDDMEALGFYNSGLLYGSTGNNSPDPADLNRFFIIDKSDASLVEQAKIDPTDEEKDFEACDCLTGGANNITGTIFHDQNGNGILTMGESGLGGVQVNLFRDVDMDSAYTAGVDILLDSTTTLIDGTYDFTFAASGTFIITIDTTDLPMETGLTTDNKESAQFIGIGQTNQDNNFGYINLTYDYGDLPDLGVGTTGLNDYETLHTSNGPSHLIVAGLSLGNLIDKETDGIPNTLAQGDDLYGTADEDGINLLPSLDIRPEGVIRLPFSIINTTGDTAYIEAWIDWNGDGDFDNINELVTDYKDNKDGVFPMYLLVNIPANAVTEHLIGFRVRLSNEDNMTPYGRINSGEIEDYLIKVSCPEIICLPIESQSNKE